MKKPKLTFSCLPIWVTLPLVLQSEAMSATAPIRENSDSLISKKKPPSTEWKNLPKQKWEIFGPTVIPPNENTPLVERSKSKTQASMIHGFFTQCFPSSEPLPVLGQVIGAKNPSNYIGSNELIYIKSKGLAQVGEIYALTEAPEVLKSYRSDRIGYSYLILGTVKILAIRDGIYLGRVLTARTFVSRGTFLIAQPTKVPDSRPIAGPGAIEAELMLDHRISTFTTAQHKEVFINRGSNDGLKPGMIFRSYQHYDPSNDKKISSAQFVVDAEIQVTQVSPDFSSGIVSYSNTPIQEHTKLILLTDVSDLVSKEHLTKKDPSLQNQAKDPLDELDRLDGVVTIGPKEKNQILQLEKTPLSNPSTPKTQDIISTDPALNTKPQPDAAAEKKADPSLPTQPDSPTSLSPSPSPSPAAPPDASSAPASGSPMSLAPPAEAPSADAPATPPPLEQSQSGSSTMESPTTPGADSSSALTPDPLSPTPGDPLAAPPASTPPVSGAAEKPSTTETASSDAPLPPPADL